ncbi:MAG: hypothetical protein AB8G77_12250 [Rhodothermales bacterium]
MKTQIPADPVSSNEKYLVWGLFACFIFIILMALLPDTLYEWINMLIQPATEPVIQG